jgi:anti-sigma-K factor RskA
VQHCAREQLALAALSETLPADDAAHLASCPRCQAEVAALRRPVDVLTAPPLTGTGPDVPPPPRVWDAIAAATGVSTAPRVDSPPAEVVPLRRRLPPGRWLGVAAAALVGVVIGAGAVALSGDDGGSVVAATTLEPLPAEDASGRAEVREADGMRLLEVDLDAPSLTDGYYEVWLLQPDAVRMVPLGAVHRGDTVLPLPSGLDLGAYPLVDVSIEPMDGDPTHSGVSVARGQLRT